MSETWCPSCRAGTCGAHPVRQSIDNLHPSIVNDVLFQKRIVIKVIDPSPGVWGGDPVEGLVTVVYDCNCRDEKHPRPHHALYGPKDETWTPDRGPVEEYTIHAD